MTPIKKMSAVLGSLWSAMLIWFYSQYALLAIAAIYVSHGFIWWIFRLLGRLVRPARD